MFRFLHIADVHLDTRFICRRPDVRERLREAVRVAFARAVDFAVDQRVHAVLVAGDLFDNDRLSFRSERALVEQCRRLDAAGITTVYVSGNHDPGGSRFRASAITWPERFHYVGGGLPTVVDVLDGSGDVVGRVIGAGHASARESTNLAALFPAADGRIPHVGLLHTMVTGAVGVDSHERYAPCTVEDLRRTRYAYWALGHVHVRQHVCEISSAYYPGNLQGRHARETGPKGGYFVELEAGGAPRVTFRQFAPVVWDEIRLDALADVFNLHELVQRVRSRIAAIDADPGEGMIEGRVLRVSLAGPSPVYDRLIGADAIHELETELMDELGTCGVIDVEIRTARLTRTVNLAEHRNQPHVLGEILALLESIEEDDELLTSVLPSTLAGIRERDIPNRLAYARELLVGLDYEAAFRLLKEGAT